MNADFDYFVLLAEMRTGSNFLETCLNDYVGIHCHGEAFNPHFIGHANQTEMFGYTVRQREENPIGLIALMKENTGGLAGFRFFHDHDPRVLAHVLSDRRCAKIILTRNPLDTYVSMGIVRQTGQWRLGDMRKAKSAKMKFNLEEFNEHLDTHQKFQLSLHRQLQLTGQTAFHINYEDISDIEVLNGLAEYLGVTDKLKKVSKGTKKQNPQPLDEKVSNYPEMEKALGSFDFFDLNRTPNFEPRRGPSVPNLVAAARAPIIYMPIRSGPLANIRKWLADLDGEAESELTTGFTQKTLRQWKRQLKGHLSFTVVRHPVERLHHAFKKHILLPGPENYGEIRETLKREFKLPIPAIDAVEQYDTDQHRAAFVAFADFIKGNLRSQSSIRVDPAWASQSELIRGMSSILSPDHIFREDRLQSDLDHMAAQLGLQSPKLAVAASAGAYAISDIYDREVETAVKSAYQRDYMMFGFDAWDKQ